MNPRIIRLLAAAILFGAGLTRAQAPMAKPLADFDRLVSQLNTANVIGEPIRAGNTAIIPFAKISFGIGSGAAAMGVAGGINGKTVPLGILIVQDDAVRAELIPEPEEKSGLLQQILQAFLQRKVVIMGNGLNLGQTSMPIEDLAPLISGMLGQTTIIGNALNVGHQNLPAPAKNGASPSGNDGSR